MAVFVLRRLLVSFLTLLASTFIMYVLVAGSGDPLGDLRLNPSPNRANLIAARIQLLHLDESVPQRYVGWLKGAAGCVLPGVPCDLGANREGQAVTVLLQQAMSSTLRLVAVATIVAFVLGVLMGVISALRQYSGFDYTLTFAAFLFFSLPVFWVAALLKQYLAIGFDDWFVHPVFHPAAVVLLSLASGLTWGAIIGGDRRRTWIARVAGAVGAAVILVYLSAVEWFRRPALGPVLIIVLGAAVAVGFTVLVSGLARRRVLYAALATAGVGGVVQFFVTPFLDSPGWASWTNVAVLGAVAVLVAAGIGAAAGGVDRGAAIRASVFTALSMGFLIVIDLGLRAVPGYARAVNGIVMPTTGSNTPNFSGTFWETQDDLASHLALPTIAIMLISFAGYSRYSRSSMLEVMGQDYVRTARAKGLTERTVVVRHALRNALIPLTTLAAYDFGGILGGAVITEAVFSWRGMGFLFQQGVLRVDPNPVMGFYIITAVAVVIFNMLADISYAYLDPRIRLS